MKCKILSFNNSPKEMVDWRKEYLKDTIFSIFILLMIISLYFLDLKDYIIIPAIVGIFIRLQSIHFFNKKKYE